MKGPRVPKGWRSVRSGRYHQGDRYLRPDGLWSGLGYWVGSGGMPKILAANVVIRRKPKPAKAPAPDAEAAFSAWLESQTGIRPSMLEAFEAGAEWARKGGKHRNNH